jgi:Astacin (Peptidase family M12A)
METIEKYTCVRFYKRSNEVDYLSIVSDIGCWSHMGKIGGKQELSLEKGGCFGTGTIMHELIHALGYDHMHSSADRDKYIDIKYENIRQDSISNFDRVDPKKFSNFGTKYDLYSLMHYDSKAFSKNGKDTIVPKNRQYTGVIGQRLGLSYDDVKRINNMYKCKS